MRLGVLGGSFNPPHLGHLLIADDVRTQLRLDQILFVPARQPPNRTGPLATYEQRAAMVRLALRGSRGFALSLIEGSLPTPSCTVNTLQALRDERPGATLWFILGCDQYTEMTRWHCPELLDRLARLVVMTRPGTRRPRLFRAHNPRRVRFLNVIPVAISGAQIRDRLAKAAGVRYMLPVKVLDYIHRHRLYACTGRTA